MIKVSVIVPVYNAEKYLKKMLNSVCRQTLSQIEVICVDDGSKDASFQILKAFARKDSRILALQQAHAGAGAARNLGIKTAKGKYLSFLDADDFFEPDMLEEAWNACERENADICIFRSDCFSTRTNRYQKMLWTIDKKLLPKTNSFAPQDIYPYVFQAFNGWAWDKLYRKDAVLESGLWFQTIRTSNDAYFVFLMNLQAKRITVLDKTLAHHRTDLAVSLSATREKSWACCWQAVCAIQKELKARDWFEATEQSFINWALCFLLWNGYSMKNADARKRLYRAMREKYFPSLGIDKYPKSYFYNANVYEEYKNICWPDGMKKTLRQMYLKIQRKLAGKIGCLKA